MLRICGLVGAALVLLSAACTSNGAGAGSAGDIIPAPPIMIRAATEYHSSLVEGVVEVSQGDVLLEDFISSCMAQEGFDYEPPEVATASGDRTAAITDGAANYPDTFSREYREALGYGISTLWVYSMRSSSVVAPSNGPEPGAEGSQYLEALLGSNGCQQQAHDEVAERGTEPQFDVLDDDLFYEFSRRLYASEAVVVAQKEWARCAQALGYDNFNSLEDVEDYFYNKVDPSLVLVQQEYDETFEPSDEQLEEAAAAGEELEFGFSSDEFNQALVDDVATEEIATATELFPCEVEFYRAIGPHAAELATELGL